MRVTLLLFAHLAELAGARSMELELADGTTARDALDAFLQRVPEAEGYRGRIAFALDDAYCAAGTTLAPGSELAFIPPVSGG